MKLYEISSDYKGLVSLVESGELSQDDIKDTLEGIESTMTDKIKACMALIKESEHYALAASAESKRLDDLAKAEKKKADSLNEYVKSCMIAAGIDKIDCGIFKLSLRKETKQLGDIKEELIPSKYWVDIPASKRIDKKLLLSDAKLEEIKGVELKDSNRSLQVK